MNVIITGCSGFIGRNLVSNLLNKGFSVLGIDIYESDDFKKNKSYNNFSFIANDNLLFDRINKFANLKYDCLFHLAWKGVSLEFRNDYNTQISNLTNIQELFQIAKVTKVIKIITIGSTMEYMYNNQVIGGNPFPKPSNLYGSIKLSSRYIIEQMCKANNIHFVYAITTSVYGIGRDDNNVINYTIDKLLKSEVPLLTNLNQEWDFIHINDLINVLYLLTKNTNESGVYAVGNGDNFQLKEYVDIILNLIDPNLKLGIGKISQSSLQSSKIDNSSIKKLGFQQSISFIDGVKEIIEYKKAAVSKLKK